MSSSFRNTFKEVLKEELNLSSSVFFFFHAAGWNTDVRAGTMAAIMNPKEGYT